MACNEIKTKSKPSVIEIILRLGLNPRSVLGSTKSNLYII